MPNFDYREIPEILEARFDNYLASDLWRALINEPTYQNLDVLKEEGYKQKLANPITCKRVFISHRQSDARYAERIAYLATQCNFEYWLDVHDPTLKIANGINILKPKKSILIAGIIEMALINCSHVMAVMTTKTKGSQWVPYEYGRIADVPGVYDACAWQDPSLIDVPGYMYLRPRLHDRKSIDGWFKSQNPNCTVTWNNPIPKKLPNE
jgi:hypothetical protein